MDLFDQKTKTTDQTNPLEHLITVLFWYQNSLNVKDNRIVENLIRCPIVFLTFSGAITTITTLLKSPDTRCAAITMLGKTVELCLTLLNEKCDPSKLNELRITLQTVRLASFVDAIR